MIFQHKNFKKLHMNTLSSTMIVIISSAAAAMYVIISFGILTLECKILTFQRNDAHISLAMDVLLKSACIVLTFIYATVACFFFELMFQVLPSHGSYSFMLDRARELPNYDNMLGPEAETRCKSMWTECRPAKISAIAMSIASTDSAR